MTDKERQTGIFVWSAAIGLAIAIIGGSLVISQKRNTPIEGEAPPAVTVSSSGSAEPVMKAITAEATPAPVIPEKAPVPESGAMALAIPVLWEGSNRLPLEHTCYRSNTTPPVEWSGVSPNAKSLALIMEKRAGGNPQTYWLLYNIPASESGLAAGLPGGPELENGARYGRSGHGVVQYSGPCDPKGKIPYAFRLYALDTVLDLAPGATGSELMTAMEGHIIDTAELPFIHYLRF